MHRLLLFVSVLSLSLLGCASGPESNSETAEQPPVVAEVDLDRRPLVLETDAELRGFVREFSLVVEEAEELRRDLATDPFEEQVARIEMLRGHLDRWRDISEDAVLDAETSDISPDAYERFMADLGVLRARLWDIVREINGEIAEASGVDPVRPVPEG